MGYLHRTDSTYIWHRPPEEVQVLADVASSLVQGRFLATVSMIAEQM